VARSLAEFDEADSALLQRLPQRCGQPGATGRSAGLEAGAPEVGQQAVAGRDLGDLEISPGPGQPVPERSRPRPRPYRPARHDHLCQDQERHRNQQRDAELNGGEHKAVLL